MVNLFTAGDNNRHKVYSEDISIIDSFFERSCSDDEMRVVWEAREGIFTEIGLTELGPGEFVPSVPPAVELDWDDCGLQ